jgi:hypothetical protein
MGANVSNSKMPGTVNGDGSRGTQLTGRTLAIARLVWITLSLLVAGLFIWALSLWNLSQEEIPFSFLMPFGYFVTGLVIFWRKSDDLIGLLTSLMLIFFGPYLISGANIIVSEQLGWEIIGAVMVGLGSSVVIFFLFLFPNGSFAPRWTRWFALVLSILIVISSFVAIWPNLEVIVFLLGAFVGLLSQVFRYFRVSKPIQRQQTKWVLIGLSGPLLVILLWLTLGSPVITEIIGLRLLDSPIPITYVIPLFALLLPLTIAFSILRYRLWDIDILIRRTLVYAVLTALLLLLYFGSVVLLQQVFRGLTGQDSPIVIVISTLVIAALFSPLRSRIQNTIDRRFYRSKYDAQRALAKFAATARDEVNMDMLTTALLVTVEDTMQPDQVSLWMKQTSQQSLTTIDRDDWRSSASGALARVEQ